MARLQEQLASLAQTAADTLKAGKIKADPEEATRRFQICLACPELQEGKLFKHQCKKCGCNMGLKVSLHAAKCADKEQPKW